MAAALANAVSTLIPGDFIPRELAEAVTGVSARLLASTGAFSDPARDMFGRFVRSTLVGERGCPRAFLLWCTSPVDVSSITHREWVGPW